MDLWSVETFAYGTAVVVVLMNVVGGLALLRDTRRISRLAADLAEHPEPLYQAVLLGFAYDAHDRNATAWAAIHHAVRDPGSQHALTAAGRGSATAAEIINDVHFLAAHSAEVERLSALIPSIGAEDIFRLRNLVHTIPAVVISGWVAVYWTVRVVVGVLPGDGPGDEETIGAIIGGLMCGTVGWALLFGIALGLQVVLWWLPYRSWERRMRARAAAVVRRELGDAYPTYLADLRHTDDADLRRFLPTDA